MADNPLVVALLKEFCDEASITRTEVGTIIGKNRNQIAGICDRNGIVPWPHIPKRVLENRGCQFPRNIPDTSEFAICGMFRTSDPLVCNDHKGKVWVPECKMLSIKK
jgi:hypothetical protein